MTNHENEKSKFKLTSTFLDKYKNVRPPFGFDGLGELTYTRTYSRIKEDGKNEVWWETVARVVEGTFSMQKRWIESRQLGWSPRKAQVSAHEMYDRIFNMKFLPPGRGLWAMGSALTEERGIHAALNNCAFISTENIKEDLASAFCFLMDASMLGVGVGFDTKGAGKIVVKGIDKDADSTTFVIDDTREAWVESMKVLIESYFTKQPHVTFDYSQIRPEGLPIKGFGGVSSGPGPLRECHEVVRKILEGNSGTPLTITTIVDIMNLIGKCVVAGNVRRCLPKGTLVHCRQGLVPIEQVKAGDEVYTASGVTTVSEMVEQGKQEAITLRTQLGEFQCTDKHRMARMTAPGRYEWVQAKELQSGDRLVFPEHQVEGNATQLPAWEYKKPDNSTTCKDITIPELDAKMAWFFGLFHGDGYTYPNTSDNGFNAYVAVACAPDYPAITEECRTQIKRFGVNLCDVPPSENDKCTKVRAQSKQLAWYLAKFKTASETISIPEFILQGTASIRAAYVAGLFDADGGNGRPTCLATSVYHDYLQQVQAVYASLGIPTRLSLRRAAVGKWKTLFQLRLVGEHAIARFKATVAPFALKYSDTRTTTRSQFDYGFPAQWVKDSKLAIQGAWSQNSDQMTYALFQSLGGETNSLIPIEVFEIVEGEVVETYDISVPGANEFIAGPGLLVHNTAEIVFGDPFSDEYLDLKNYQKNPQREEFGWTSNNSIFAELGMDYKPSAERVKLNGEPGFAWLQNMQEFSRMGDPKDNKDRRVSGGNPCLEQSLESGELCCLVETFPHNHTSLEDFKVTLKYAYMYAKTVTLGETHWPETNRVMLRNRRIGCSMSGIAQFLHHRGIHEFKDWCEQGYKALEYYDEVYSDWLAIPKSIKKTSIKPSGTVSLLAGATPGMHFPESRFYIRRMRLSKHSDLIEPLRKAGYYLEPCYGSEDSTVVVEIPVAIAGGVRTVAEVSMWEQLSLAAFIQKYWADNQVSSTITFKKYEADQIAPALDYFQYQLKGISFLPFTEKGAYRQMPYEAITEEVYKEKAAGLRPLKLRNVAGEEAEVEKFCNNDSCLIK